MTDMPKRIKAWRHEIKGDDGFVHADGFWFVEEEPAIPEAEKYVRVDIYDAEVEKLREALQPFAEITIEGMDPTLSGYELFASLVENARHALKRSEY